MARMAAARGGRRPGRPADRCTASRASGGSTSTRFPGCRATKARLRCASATRAVRQLQLDVYGEVLDAFYVARRAGLATERASWALECALVAHLETIWRRARRGHLGSARRAAALHALEGDGVGRVRSRGALDRGVRPRRAARALARGSRRDSSRGVRARLRSGAERVRPVFRRRQALDASLLLIPIVGFLPPDDPRVRGTVAAIERRLAARRIRAALRHRRRDRRPAARRGRVPRLQLLARRQLCAAGPLRRGARLVRSPVGVAQRRRAAGGGIRPASPSASSAISPRRSRIWR